MLLASLRLRASFCSNFRPERFRDLRQWSVRKYWSCFLPSSRFRGFCAVKKQMRRSYRAKKQRSQPDEDCGSFPKLSEITLINIFFWKNMKKREWWIVFAPLFLTWLLDFDKEWANTQLVWNPMDLSVLFSTIILARCWDCFLISHRSCAWSLCRRVGLF